jgi:hypothetical protein
MRDDAGARTSEEPARDEERQHNSCEEPISQSYTIFDPGAAVREADSAG